MGEKEPKLFTDFAPVSTEEWEAKINADLKGKDYERALVWRTYEGFNIRPYYRRENLENIQYLNTLPGEFPFVRGNNKNNSDWLVRQDIFVKDLEDANKKALAVLGKGITSLGFHLDSCNKITKTDFDILLKNICLKLPKLILFALAIIAIVPRFLLNMFQKENGTIQKLSHPHRLIRLLTLSYKGKMGDRGF